MIWFGVQTLHNLLKGEVGFTDGNEYYQFRAFVSELIVLKGGEPCTEKSLPIHQVAALIIRT